MKSRLILTLAAFTLGASANAFADGDHHPKYGGVVAEPEVAETADASQADFETMIGNSAELEEPASTSAVPSMRPLETVEIAAPQRKTELIDRLNRWLSKVGRPEAGNV